MEKNPIHNLLDVAVTILAGFSLIGMIIGWINNDLPMMVFCVPFVAVGLDKVIDYFYYYSRIQGNKNI